MSFAEVSLDVEVRFNESDLRRKIISPDAVPDGDTFLLLDYALTNGDRSDLSAIAAVKIAEVEGKRNLYILDVISDRWSVRELPYQIVKAVTRFTPKTVIIERLSMYQLLEMAVQTETKLRNVEANLHFIKPSKKPDAKRDRIRAFQNSFQADRVYFVNGTYISTVFHQLTNFSNTRNNRGRKDDSADVLGYAALLLNGRL